MTKAKLAGWVRNYLRKIKDYWLGSVDVYKGCISRSEWPEEKRLKKIAIMPALHNKGAWLGHVRAGVIEDILKCLGQKPNFELRVDFGPHMYQKYTFNKHQQKLLSTELSKIFDEEVIYKEEGE